jgi:hypothetical protein
MNKPTDDAGRRRAQELWDKNKQQDAKALSDRDAAQRAEAAKTARLRELRLAKEAADKAAEQTSGRRPSRRAKAPSAKASGKDNDLPSKVETPE